MAAVSEPLSALVSDRWNTKKEAIEIKNYKFEEFYQFLYYLYSNLLELNERNIYSMIDLAEYYDIPLLKETCEIYLLTKFCFTVKNIFNLIEISQKYSLSKLNQKINKMISSNIIVWTNCKEFLALEKSVIETVISFKEESWKNPCHEKELFKAVSLANFDALQ